MMSKKSRNLLSLLTLLLVYVFLALPVHATSSRAEKETAVSQSISDVERVKEAEKMIESQPESSPLTEENKEDIVKHYAEIYIPKKGCSLLEDLPKNSDINYVEPKPKPKPKPKPNAQKVEAATSSKSSNVRTTKITSSKKTGNSISMSKEERIWLEKLIQAEAGDQPYEGRVAVATTIANRVESSRFPNTVMGVIKAGNSRFHQYSPWDDGSIYKKTASQETIRAVQAVFDDGERILPAETVYFCTTAIANRSWIGKTRKHIKTIQDHAFYSIDPK